MVSYTVEVVHELSALTFKDTTNIPGFVNTCVGLASVLILDPSPKSHSEANVNDPYPSCVLFVNLMVSVSQTFLGIINAALGDPYTINCLVRGSDVQPSLFVTVRVI